MRFTKPAWVAHQESGDKKRASIFSINVHPDGSRIATGGLDGKIQIWATLPILNPEYDDSNPGVDGTRAPPKKLCTLSMHAGPVLCVRWSYSGKWLASGSDDTIIMIWDLDPNGGGKVWGSDDVNVEGWKALKRLPGHDSDVTDLAFSPGDRYLASVGLDSKVLIWNGGNLELLRKLDQHQGFVKGVCWDPVGQYLATQSDDKSVMIWNTTDWSLETTITQPFEKSPGSTFFRRLSWSPDGAHITASNAMNNNGYVFVAAVISRSSWTSNISLVGHENTVEVSAYNPHIFRRDVNKPVHTQNICSVVALGSDDLSLSIWQTKSARPLIVAKDVFERPIMDLSWSLDGLTLYACSSDGFIGVFDFDEHELEGIAPLSVQAEYLKLFNFVPPPIVNPYIPPTPMREVPRYNSPQHPNAPPYYHPQVRAPLTPANGSSAPETVYVNGKKKKRIQPVFVSHLSSSPGGLPTMGSMSQPSQQNYAGGGSQMGPPHGQPYSQLAESSRPYDPYSSRHGGGEQVERFGPLSNPSLPPQVQQQYRPESSGYRHSSLSEITYANGDSGHHGSHRDRDRDTRMGSWESDGGGAPGEAQFTSLAAADDDVSATANGGRPAPKARTLGGDRQRDGNPITIREIRTVALPMDVDTRGETSASGARIRLPIPSVRTLVSAKIEDREGEVFEGKNSEDPAVPPEVSFSTSKGVQFLDFVSHNVILVAATTLFCAAALEDGSLNIYSPTGRRLMPTILLDSPCVSIDACKSYLMAITSTARIYIWNIKLQQAHMPSTTVQPLISSSSPSLLSATVRPNGSPVLLLSDGVAYSFDVALSAWVKVSEARWGQGSQVWEGKQRTTTNRTSANSKSVMSSIESALSDLDLRNQPPAVLPDAPDKLPQWWNVALTLGHLETRMHSSRLLDSPAEYKTNLLLYAKRIADEGFRAKAEELLRELAGPLYWKPNREETWTPTVLGMQKRDLLKDVMRIFAGSRTLAKLGQEWQETMKKTQSEE